MPSSFSVRQAIAESLKKNIGPGLLLQAFAVALLLSFYYHEPTQDFFRRITALRAQTGVLYGIVSTALFGGLIPFVIQRCRPAHRWRAPFKDLPFFLLFWGLMGFVVDRFYVLQAAVFGDGADLATVVTKVAVDQGFFAPFLAVPFIALAYTFKDCGYRFSGVLKTLNKQWLRQDLLPMLIANAMVWLPTTVVVYLLPLALQLPIQNLAQCFWCVLLLFLTTPRPKQN